MTLLPTQWVPNQAYTASEDRHLLESLGAKEGPVDITADFVPTVPIGGDPNRSIRVSAGRCFIKGDDAVARQGVYHQVNDASEMVPLAAAHATLARIDRVSVQVVDGGVFGGSSQRYFVVTTGTPAASPVAPGLPPTAMPVANVLSAAGAAGVVVPADISDARPGSSGGAIFPLYSGPLTNAGSHTFPNLNGNDNCVYTLEFNIQYAWQAATRYPHIRPNGLIAGITAPENSHYAGASHGAITTAVNRPFMLWQTGADFQALGHVELASKAPPGAANRMSSFYAAEIAPTYRYHRSGMGSWADTATPITSLVFHGDGGLFSGWLKLDRKPLV